MRARKMHHKGRRRTRNKQIKKIKINKKVTLKICDRGKRHETCLYPDLVQQFIETV